MAMQCSAFLVGDRFEIAVKKVKVHGCCFENLLVSVYNEASTTYKQAIRELALIRSMYHVRVLNDAINSALAGGDTSKKICRCKLRVVCDRSSSTNVSCDAELSGDVDVRWSRSP